MTNRKTPTRGAFGRRGIPVRDAGILVFSAQTWEVRGAQVNIGQGGLRHLAGADRFQLQPVRSLNGRRRPTTA